MPQAKTTWHCGSHITSFVIDKLVNKSDKANIKKITNLHMLKASWFFSLGAAIYDFGGLLEIKDK